MIGASHLGLTVLVIPSRAWGATGILILFPLHINAPSGFLLPLCPQTALSPPTQSLWSNQMQEGEG